MTMEAHIQGTPYKLDLEALSSDRFRVHLDGDAFESDVCALGDSAYSLIIDGRQLELSLLEGRDGLEIELDGFRYPVLLVDPRRRSDGAGLGGCEGTALIKSTMPGKVIKLLVEEGQTVEAGTGLIVLEAMKMQNELKAANAGTIKKIYIRDGDKVEANAKLLEIKSD